METRQGTKSRTQTVHGQTGNKEDPQTHTSHKYTDMHGDIHRIHKYPGAQMYTDTQQIQGETFISRMRMHTNTQHTKTHTSLTQTHFTHMNTETPVTHTDYTYTSTTHPWV